MSLELYYSCGSVRLIGMCKKNHRSRWPSNRNVEILRGMLLFTDGNASLKLTCDKKTREFQT